jgi:hypothetical protein
VRFVRLPLGPPDSRFKGEAFGGARLIGAVMSAGRDTVEVAQAVDLVPNTANMFSRRWIGLSQVHLVLTEESEAFLRPGSAASR